MTKSTVEITCVVDAGLKVASMPLNHGSPQSLAYESLPPNQQSLISSLILVQRRRPIKRVTT